LLKINNIMMTNLNAIGLDVPKSQYLAEKLNELLANYSRFLPKYQKFPLEHPGRNVFEPVLTWENCSTTCC